MIQEFEQDSNYYGTRIRVITYFQDESGHPQKGDRSAALILNNQGLGWHLSFRMGLGWMIFRPRLNGEDVVVSEAEARLFVEKSICPAGIRLPVF